VIGYVHAMDELGRELTQLVFVIAVVLGAAMVAACAASIAADRSAGWRRRHAERRYVRDGIRELEVYLGRAQHARRPR
jgi:hypothetical protein